MNRLFGLQLLECKIEMYNITVGHQNLCGRRLAYCTLSVAVMAHGTLGGCSCRYR